MRRRRRKAAAALAAAAVLACVGAASPASGAPPFALSDLGTTADTIPALPSPVPLDKSPLPRTSLLGYPEGAKFPLNGEQQQQKTGSSMRFFFFFPTQRWSRQKKTTMQWRRAPRLARPPARALR